MLTGKFGRGIMHGIMCGLAGVAPRSVIQNLITLLVWLLTKVPGDSRIWARDVLFGVGNGEIPWPSLTRAPQNDFVQCRADDGTKERFLIALTQLSVFPVSEASPWNLN